MRLEIYEDEKKVEKEKVLRLRLIDECGEAALAAVDEKGEMIDVILRIQADGTLYRYCDITRNMGLRLDSKGRIKLDEEAEE